MRLLIRLFALSVLLVVLTGCISTAPSTKATEGTSPSPPSLVLPTDTPPPSPATPTATPFPSPAPLTKAAISSCPVTLPNGKWPPNDHDHGLGNEAGTLFTNTWPGGKVIFTPHGAGVKLPDGSLGMKWPWYRTIPGDVIITGRRLDAPAPPMLTITIPRGAHYGYGETGFYPSGLLFPSEGCWQVTAKLGETSLTFVTLVVKVSFDPLKPRWLPEGLRTKDTDLTGLPQSIREIYSPPIWRDPLWHEYLIGWGEGEVSIETTQGVRENPIFYPDAAKRQVTVRGQPAQCVQGTWDVQHQWRADADAGTLEWTADGFSYRISHTGLGLHCEDLQRIAESLR